MAADSVSVIDAPRTPLRKFGRYGLLTLIAAVILFPIYTTIVASIRPGEKTFESPIWPKYFTLDTLRQAWTDGNLGRYLVNSAVVAIIVVIFQLLTSVLAGYAFTFLDFPGRTALFGIFLATMLVPTEATLLVNARTVDTWGWRDTFAGLSVPFLATAAGTFLIRQAFNQIPGELREAAEMDGLGHLRFLYEVATPLIRPTLGALGLFSFLTTWNQYLWPQLITDTSDMRTVQSGLNALNGAGLQDPNLVMAGTLIAAIPIFLLLVLFQKQLVRGLTAGAVKG